MKSVKRKFNKSSDTEIDRKTHDKLLNEVLTLNKKSDLKKATRSEPTLRISEFDLVKSVRGKHGEVRVNELTKVLKKRAKYVEINKKIKSAGQKAKTLPKPLEKPQAERVRRSVAFDNVKKHLGRWDAVITSNRASNHLTFPLVTDTKIESSKNFCGYRLKSDLQKKLEASLPKVEVFNLEKESEYPLTMQEMLERRKEMAKMRAVQSYKEAKARRQNKIKSKKYHRIQRNEKVKKQIKEFEKLQKDNPEEALKKLEEIERVRAEERASLRHRSTGQWAKNKQVRAKYDKDTRQVLAQQLQISRELTQKVKAHDEDSESEEELTNTPVLSKSSANNPWVNPTKTSGEIENFLSGYRKFWESENKTTVNHSQSSNVSNGDSKSLQDKEIKILTEQKQNRNIAEEKVIKDNLQDMNEVPEKNIKEKELKIEKIKRDQLDAIQKPEAKKQSIKIEKLLHKNDTKNSFKKPKQLKCGQKLTEKAPAKKIKDGLKIEQNYEKFIGTSPWDVSSLSDSSDDNKSKNSDDEIDAIFDNYEERVQKQIKLKKELLKQKTKQKGNKKQNNRVENNKTKKKKNKIDLSFPESAKRPVIDEELLETSAISNGNENIPNNESAAILVSILKNSSMTDENVASKPKKANNIDPNNIIKTKPVNLNTEIPNLLTLDENEENADQRVTISEAFEDDDIIEEFKKSKQDEIIGEKPKDINLALPGWGSWGGTGIKPLKRKNKRFILKFPKKFKRRDDNKGNLIINEKADAKLKPHLISEVPFPFKSVKDFEATIRAPIGSTFVPETAFRKMIRPAVTTKIGTIIEPMTDDILLKKKK